MRPDVHRQRLYAGLCLAALCASPAAADERDCAEAERLLLLPELRSEADRAREAEDLIVQERRRKLASVSSAAVEVGLHASLQASPLRLVKSIRDLGRSLLAWDDRAPEEDAALELLAPAARNGTLDPDAHELFTRLSQRESEARIDELLDEGRRALAGGDLRRARRSAERALELEPDSKPAARLLDAIDARTWRDAPEAGPESATPGAGVVDAWEVRVATSLLVDDYARVRALADESRRDAELARAAARYLEGERGAALDDFAELAEGDDAAAASAQRWLADPGLNPETVFEREVASFRTRRALGWMGGEALAATALPTTEEALQISRDGYKAWQGSYRAWRDSFRLVNLLVDAPARAWRAWQPDGSDLHDAAARYLEVAPDGARAPEAAAWLQELNEQERETARTAAFRDGWLELPHARTPFSRLATTRLVVSRDALAAAAPELLAELGSGEAPAVMLSLVEPGEPVEGAPEALAASRSLELLSRVASGVEAAELDPRGDSPRDVLEALRRLDRSVRAGRSLRAEPWNPTLAGVAAVGMALVDGGRVRTAAGVAVERDEERVTAERELGGAGAFCPQETPCVDLHRELSRGLYARTDADGDFSVGAAAGFASAQLAVEVGTSGPRASLVLPFARWLGLGHFFPVEARLGVGLDGISSSPDVDDDAAPEEP